MEFVSKLNLLGRSRDLENISFPCFRVSCPQIVHIVMFFASLNHMDVFFMKFDHRNNQ